MIMEAATVSNDHKGFDELAKQILILNGWHPPSRRFLLPFQTWGLGNHWQYVRGLKM